MWDTTIWTGDGDLSLTGGVGKEDRCREADRWAKEAHLLVNTADVRRAGARVNHPRVKKTPCLDNHVKWGVG